MYVLVYQWGGRETISDTFPSRGVKTIVSRNLYQPKPLLSMETNVRIQ